MCRGVPGGISCNFHPENASLQSFFGVHVSQIKDACTLFQCTV